MKDLYGLIDCNSFYASCEKIFRPDLRMRPVVVLSNNDGCIVSLSPEARAAGFKRCTPIYQVMERAKEEGVEIFSSNYELYGDISNRVMNLLADCFPSVEVYSIDEAFVDLRGIENVDELCRQVRTRVMKELGLPIAIGVGPTKTLAKLANKIGKDYPCYGGYFNITNHPRLERIFESYRVDAVWGIGFQSSKALIDKGILTIADLVRADEGWIKKRLTIRGLYTLWELRGRSCIELDTGHDGKKTILSSRSFGAPVSDEEELFQAVTFHIDLAAVELRSQGSLCSFVTVFIAENRFREGFYSASRSIALPGATAFTPPLVEAAEKGLRQIYREGCRYIKAGVILSGLTDDGKRQFSLFDDREQEKREEELIKRVDEMNRKYGKGTLNVGAFHKEGSWSMRRDHRSPLYTTSWEELPEANC